MTQEKRPDGADPGELFTDPTHMRQDLTLLKRALVEEWPLTEKTLRIGVKVAEDVAEHGKDERARIKAVEVLAILKGQNQKMLLAALGLSEVTNNTQINNTQINVNGGDVREGVKQLLSEPDYVEYVRQRTVATDSDAGLVCQIREQGHGEALENGSSHGGVGPGTNGHRNGSK